MPYRRGWVALLLFALALINDIDRVTLSFDAWPITREFGLMAPIVTGYVVAATGGGDTAFVIAGVLPVVGAASILTRRPIGERSAGSLPAARAGA